MRLRILRAAAALCMAEATTDPGAAEVACWTDHRKAAFLLVKNLFTPMAGALAQPAE